MPHFIYLYGVDSVSLHLSISLLLLLASLLESAQWSHCFHPSVLGPTGLPGRREIIHRHASRKTKGLCFCVF